jgi:hypothetical protein
MWVLTGDDDDAIQRRRLELCTTPGEPVRVDIGDDGGARQLFDAVTTVPMFAEFRVIDVNGLELLTDAQIRDLAAAAPVGGNVIVARARTVGNLTGPLRGIATFETFKRTGASNAHAPERVVRTFADAGITISGADAAQLLQSCGGDWSRFSSAARALAAAGFTTPTVTQIAALCGHAATTVMPWDVTDGLDGGNVRQLDAVAELEPFPAAGWFAKQALTVAAVAEGTDPDTIRPKPMSNAERRRSARHHTLYGDTGAAGLVDDAVQAAVDMRGRFAASDALLLQAAKRLARTRTRR